MPMIDVYAANGTFSDPTLSPRRGSVEGDALS